MASMLDFACVLLGGGLGAGCRHLLSGPIAERIHLPSWVAILVVNVLGCLSAGVLLGIFGDPSSTASPHTLAFALTGFAGGFTTFSTAMLDAFVLWKGGRIGRAFGCLLATPLLGVASMLLGLLVGGRLA